MSGDIAPAKFLTLAGLVLWAVLIALPLAFYFVGLMSPAAEPQTGLPIFACALRSFALAALIAGVATVCGWAPGTLLAASRTRRDLLLLLLLMPLVLPRYALYYAWTLVLSPTTALGTYLSARPELAGVVGTFSSCVVLILWYWPLAALLIAQGWRNIDRAVWDCASLDADNLGIVKEIAIPLLVRPMLLAFGVCFVLSLSEFATFQLAGVRTIGTELAVLYELTGSLSQVARASWPAAALALILAIALRKDSQSWPLHSAGVETIRFKSNQWRWTLLLVLIGISLIAPIAILLGSMNDTQPLREFSALHSDELAWSLAVAMIAAAMAYLVAFGALSLEKAPRCRTSRFCGLLPLILRTSILMAMFVPAEIIAASFLKVLALGNVPISLRQSWWVVSAGQAARFAGVALIMLLLTRYADERCLSEMASLDGASRFSAWRYVHLPQTWPVFAGTFILIVMFSVTELSATMILLPAGLPNFAQRLLNQMHYARDQQVIASCLVLIGVFLALAVALVLLLRVARVRTAMATMVLGVYLASLAGCNGKSYPSGKPEVVDAFGQTGRGQAQFIYPRAIDIAGDGSLFVVDKTGRIQRLSPKGDFLDVIQMPFIDAGKPTGLSIAANGNLYVADTHYHRVVVFSPEGKLLNEFGKFGQEDGCFIYPTDVAFSEDGKVFVGEYGGNDRISVFDQQGGFLYCFGSSGSGPGQFARPAALCMDNARHRLYVADACNHRIAIYRPDGTLLGYIGSAGRAPGQLRYPYDLALLPDGTLLVVEYGNNRLQLFSADGRSRAVYGSPGRQLGQLAYPWGVAVDGRRCAFIVDAGNNRIQVWQL